MTICGISVKRNNLSWGKNKPGSLPPELDGQTFKQIFPGLVLIDRLLSVVFNKEKQLGGKNCLPD